ncbi:hypothetical protein [Prevotella nigrescens]|uniref:hypothetical protein n=1 Tax=Prevotella nigrescens TaxID=28133 RepID=UPI00287FF4F4|nr:hypothetical protein [Prevotella nigrescens]
MKQVLQIIFLALIGTALTACHNSTDDYMTSVTIVINGGDTLRIDRVQATATIRNLNTKQVITSTNFNGNTLQQQLLRGAYQISVDGSIQYTNQKQQTRIRSFRSQTDFIAFGDSDDYTLEMKPIFTD